MFGQGMGQDPDMMRKIMLMMQGGAENPFMQWWRARGMQNAQTLPIDNIQSLLGRYGGGGGGGSLPVGVGKPAGGLKLPATMTMPRRTPTGG